MTDDRDRDMWEVVAKTATGILKLRTEALARVVEQLDAVRALHPPTGTEWPPGVKCTRCSELYPCSTAKAAGVPST